MFITKKKINQETKNNKPKKILQLKLWYQSIIKEKLLQQNPTLNPWKKLKIKN